MPAVLNPYPIELRPGLFWLGECLQFPWEGRVLHSGSSVYLVAGDECSALIEAGVTHHIGAVMEQLAGLLARQDVPELRYAFLTHSELPHSGGVGHVLDRYPQVTALGDVTDLDLVFPEFAERFVPSNPGDRIDLGGTELVVTEGVFRDYLYTRWVYETRGRVLFSGDGFSFTHDHDAAHCGHWTEDIPDLDIPHMMAVFAEIAFNWTKYVDLEPYIERQDKLVLDELDVAMIAPTHGMPIRDPRATLARIRDGLRRVAPSD